MKKFVKVEDESGPNRQYYIDLDAINYFYFKDWKEIGDQDESISKGKILLNVGDRTLWLTKESSNELIKLLGIQVQEGID